MMTPPSNGLAFTATKGWQMSGDCVASHSLARTSVAINIHAMTKRNESGKKRHSRCVMPV
jgi:hypothetical protein